MATIFVSHPFSSEPGLIPSPVMRTKRGGYISRSFLSYNSYRRAFKDATRDCPRNLQPTGPRSVTITRIMGPRDRPMDPGNLYVGAALILDALVEAAWLAQDTPAWLSDVQCRQERSEAKGRIRVIVEDVG